jgi:predicted MFS family arabinose efflux permease
VLALAKADAAAIGVVAPELRTSLHLSDAQIGLIASLAGAAGAICALPAGTLVDRRHRTVVLTIALIVWSLGLGVAGFAAGFALLAASRLVSGGVATIARPVSVSLAGDIYRPSHRGWALARLDAGQAAGVGLCYLLGALAVHALTWRWLFWWLAAAGILLGLGASRLHDPRPTRPRGPALMAVLRTLLETKTNVIVLAADSIGNFFFAGVASFAVLFVTERYGLSTATVDALAPIIGVGVIVGILAGGRIGDRLARGQGERRLTVAAFSQLLATVIFAAALLQAELAPAGVLLFIGASVLGAAGPCLDAVRLDIMAPDIRGRGEAARGLLTLVSSALGPVTFGLVATAFGGRGDLALRDAFLVMLIPLAAGALLLLTARRPYPADAARAGMLG